MNVLLLHIVSVCVYVELHIQSSKAKTNFQLLVLQKHDFIDTLQIACKFPHSESSNSDDLGFICTLNSLFFLATHPLPFHSI